MEEIQYDADGGSIKDVSHEVCSALTIIKGAAANLQLGVAGGLSERQSRIADIILNNTDRLTKLMYQLIDISKLSQKN